MDIDAVTSTYRRWAPVYDATFGAVTRPGRRRATALANEIGGDVLEVGVGTGLALRHYGPGTRVTGIDFSDEMLVRAREKAAALDPARIAGLRQMDARVLDFPDASFDVVVAMYLISVVPEPARVLAEMARVCRPGGEVVIVNHFAAEGGPLGRLEAAMGPFADRLGWHADFSISTVTAARGLREVTRERIPPLGLFTLLRMRPAPATAAMGRGIRRGAMSVAGQAPGR
jgi:phosphatidylethanolamine/phosphatidyl-N-methylethanolamine N-methyltransferase